MKGTTMKILQVLTAAAGILVVASGPSLAAKRVHHHGFNAYASGAVNADRSGAYNYGPTWGTGALTPSQHFYSGGPAYGRNLPYADRPYGDPDRW
jgi:hypothetical protein